MSPTPSPDRVEGALAPRAGELGLDIEAVEVSAAGRHRLLRVAVDRDGGVSLDDLGEVTRSLSEALDETDLMGERSYTLEVSSPGVDRPLTRPRHWRRNHDRLVKVTTHAGESVTGRVMDSDDDQVTLDVEGQVHVVALGTVDQARVQVEFNRKEGPA
ncbi:MAG: ribosome maturation factor RimP [Actinomycetota bacterium]|nr:ribosome maturation factor RimP [Actinomycetota bacterium]